MSGHSKWATTKRHKAAVDSKRGKLFSILGRELTVAAREGGGDPDFNPRLRNCIAKAKEANMPAENVTKAIKKGTGELAGGEIEEFCFEGFGPGGVGIIVEGTTDNKNRTVSEVRSTFTKFGGNMGVKGALMFKFQRMGQFFVPKAAVSEERLMEVALTAGAEDIREEEESFEVLCPLGVFYDVSQAFENEGIHPESSQISYIPLDVVDVNDASIQQRVMTLLEKLEDLDDVSNVYTDM